MYKVFMYLQKSLVQEPSKEQVRVCFVQKSFVLLLFKN